MKDINVTISRKACRPKLGPDFVAFVPGCYLHPLPKLPNGSLPVCQRHGSPNGFKLSFALPDFLLDGLKSSFFLEQGVQCGFATQADGFIVAVDPLLDLIGLEALGGNLIFEHAGFDRGRFPQIDFLDEFQHPVFQRLKGELAIVRADPIAGIGADQEGLVPVAGLGAPSSHVHG
jgi:hypothetical protein